MALTYEVCKMIDSAHEQGVINDATYQCAADIINDCDPELQVAEYAVEMLHELCELTLEELMERRKYEIAMFKEELTPKKFCVRFEIGTLYKSEEQVISSTDWTFIVSRLLPKLKLLLTENPGLPTAKEITARLILLSQIQAHCTTYLDSPTQEEADVIHRALLANLHDHGLWEYATTEEIKLLKSNPLAIDFECAQSTFFSMNAQAVFAWCLGMIDGLPPYDTAISDQDASYSGEFIDHLPNPEHFELVASNFNRRSNGEIERARTDAESWHWRSRTLEYQRSKPIAKSSTKSKVFQERVREASQSCVSDGMFVAIDDDFPAFGKPYFLLDDAEWRKIRVITEQRHKALNWVCGLAPENNYDETPTDT